MYIHKEKEWPKFQWDTEAVINPLAEVRKLQGRLLGKMDSLGLPVQTETMAKNLTLDIVKSNEIEGEILSVEQVKSSVARKLGLDYKTTKISRRVEGFVEIMMDVSQNFDKKLTKNRLFSWHSALFPVGHSGIQKIIVGDWRNGDKGPMYVVSGGIGREKIHFQAPDASLMKKEMKQFLKWFNSPTPIDDVIKAAIVHLWFITIHPFEDGNGRIARAITDMQLGRSDGCNQRYYSMSAQIQRERKSYYAILEMTQKGSLDITSWIIWFLQCLKKSILFSEEALAGVMRKINFFRANKYIIMNKRQFKIVHKLFDGFEGKLTTSKWAKICKCSTDTALRDITDLRRKGVLVKSKAEGRSTSYELGWP